MSRNLAAKTFLLVFMILLPVGIVDASAQDSTSAGRFCFRDNGSKCKTFLITEAGMAHVLDRGMFDVHFNVEMGAMRKINDRWAWGGTLNLIYDEEDQEAFLLAVKPRVRNALYRGIHADLSAGITFARISNNGPFHVAQPSFTGSFSVGLRDWVSAILQVEHLRFEPDYVPDPAFYPEYMSPPRFGKTNWYLGISIGSYPGAVLAPIVTGLSILAEYAGDHWD